jgi:hypothetical protein
VYKWELASVWGWTKITLIVKDEVVIDKRNVLITEIVMESTYPERKRIGSLETQEVEANNPGFWNYYDEADLEFVQDYFLRLSQMVLSVENIFQLHENLSWYMKLPLHHLKTTPLHIEQQLTFAKDQSFIISILPVESNYSPATHHACKITYITSSIQGQCQFLIDPSCIQTLADGLQSYFSEKQGST